MGSFLNRIIRTDARAFFCIGLFVIAAYSFMLGSPFKTLDDDFSIVHNDEIRNLGNIPHFFKTTYFRSEKDYYRPLVYVTYALEYHFFGLNYFHYNLDNVFLHVFNACLVFLLAFLLMRERRSAFLVAFLFAIHPVHWEAVGNVSGRAILLCGFFVLSGMIFFLKYVRERKIGLLIGAALSFALGLLSKESAGVFILFALSWWFIVERKPWRSASIFIPFAVITAGYLWIRHVLGITSLFPWPSWKAMGFGVVSFLNGVLVYIRLIFLPTGLHFDRAQWVYKSLTEPGFWLTLSAYLLLATFVVRLWKRWSALTIFCLVWFAIELLPVSQIVTTIGVYPGAISLAEHFLYLAIIPVLILMVRAGEKVFDRVVSRKVASPRTMQFFFVGFFVFLFIMLVQQNMYASNEYVMLKDSLRKDPLNSRLQYSLAMVYVKVRNFDMAAEHFRKAVEGHPCNPSYHIALGKALTDKGDLIAAAKEYEGIPSRKDINLILDGNKREVYGLLVKQYENKLRLSPEDPQVLFALGVFYSKVGNNQKALWAFDRSWSLGQKRFDALFNMAAMYEALGQLDKARDIYLKLTSVTDPQNTFRDMAQKRLFWISPNPKK